MGSVVTFNSMYAVGRELGSGAFGRVVEAICRLEGVKRAVKIVNARSDVFNEEIAVMRELRHPNLLQLEDVIFEGAVTYLVLPLMSGSLWDWLCSQRQPTSVADCLGWGQQLLAGLEECHRKHIVHRDVKPENCLVEGLRLCLADFGAVARVPEGGSVQGIAGTLPYMAPEMIRGEQYGVGVDVWSAGVTLCEILGNSLPFIHEDDVELARIIVAARGAFCPASLEERPQRLQEIVSQLLHTESGSRLSAGEARLQLEEFSHVSAVKEPEYPIPIISSSLIQSMKQRLPDGGWPSGVVSQLQAFRRTPGQKRVRERVQLPDGGVIRINIPPPNPRRG